MSEKKTTQKQAEKAKKLAAKLEALEVVGGLDLAIEEEPEFSPEEGLGFVHDEEPSFLPEASEQEADLVAEELPATESVEGTELDAYESAEIEESEFVEDERVDSIIESILFASDRPVSLNSIKLVFKGTNVKSEKIKRSLERLAVEVAGARRGVSLEEVPGGYQLRTKIDNMQFLTKTLKARPFRLSGPALEVLAIVAYKQPMIKSEIDEIRGVESGHLLRALMEKNLISFAGKSDLPGKPMQYESTKKFLEIFGLRSLRELPTLSQIDELLPEGIGADDEKGSGLAQLTEKLSEGGLSSYSQGEDELNKISNELGEISTSSEFFEQEKIKQKKKNETDKAQNIREAILMGEQVTNRDRNWLSRYDEAQMLGEKFEDPEVPVVAAPPEVTTAEDAFLANDEEDQLFSEESLEANDIADIEDEGEASV